MTTVAIITDFGYFDYYTGVMKGVINSIDQNINIIDITHDINPGLIRKAAYQLLMSYKYFAPGTVFLVVVDPGVGTKRKALILKAGNYYFVAPDNGVLSYIYENDAEIIQIKTEKYFLKNISNTFHGRDIFAPVAAHLAISQDIDKFGDRLSLSEVIKFPFPDYSVTDNYIQGTILDIDRFGNIITNIPGEIINKYKVKEIGLKGKTIKNIVRAYGEAKKGEYLAITGSSGFLEISVNQGNAAEFFGLNDLNEEVFCNRIE